MKKVVQLIVFAALFATLALPAFARTVSISSSTTTTAQGQDDDAKAALYKKFLDNRTSNPSVAYDAAKEYLQKYEASAAADDKIVPYLKKWVASYEKIARRNQLLDQLKGNQVDAAFASAKTVLADYPDDLGLLYDLARAGFTAATNNNTANNADTITYARRAIQLIQSGKSFDPNKPLSDKDKGDALGLLNYGLGIITQDTMPTDATNYFITAAQVSGDMKKNPSIYALLYHIYVKNDYTKLKADYEANCKTEEQLNGQACKDLTAKVNETVDRMIDALARAVAYADASGKPADYAKFRTDWMSDLTGFYKYRSGGSDTGLKELLASITTRPLPKPGEPITPPLFPTTPATSSTTTPSTSSNTATSTKSTTTTTTQGSKTTTPPTGKTSSTKTPPKRAHN